MARNPAALPGVSQDMKTINLLLLAIALVATACGGGVDVTADETPGGDAGPPTGSWQLVEGRGQDGVVPTPEGNPITLTFEEDSSTIGGTAACNQYFGEATLDGDAIAIGSLGQTEMACVDQTVMDAERTYLTALEQVATWERAGDRLVLRGPDVELTYERLAQPPTAELTGTRWELDSLIHGTGPDGAVSSAIGEAFLVLDEDGSLAGSTGCRDLTGEWVEEDDTIRMAQLVADGDDCPPELQDQDRQVIEVLERFRAEVDGQRLTLTSRDGPTGLGYRAAG